MTELEQIQPGEGSAPPKKIWTRRNFIILFLVILSFLGADFITDPESISSLSLPPFLVLAGYSFYILLSFGLLPVMIFLAKLKFRESSQKRWWPVTLFIYSVGILAIGGGGYLQGREALEAIENTPDRYLPLGEFKSPDGHQARADSVFFSHDGRHLFISAEVAGSQTKMVEVESGKVVREFPFSRVALGPNGKLLCSDPMTADFRLVEVETGNAIWKRKAGYNSLAFGPEGKIIVAGHSNGLYLLDAATGEVQRTLSEEKKPASHSVTISFHPNTSLVAVLQSGSYFRGGPIVVWDTTTGKKVITLGPEVGTFSGFEFHPHKRILFVRLANERFWKGALISQEMKRYSRIKLKGIEIHILPGTSEARFRLLDPGRFLEEDMARPFDHRVFRIRELESGKILSTFGGAKPRLEYPQTEAGFSKIGAWSLSPDRKKLAGVGAGFIEIWDLE